MPYARNSELPPEVRGRYSEGCQTVFRRTWNEAYADSGSEEQAFRIAHTAARNCEESKMTETRGLKVARAVDLNLSEDGSVVVAFAVLGDPKDQKAEDIDKDGDVSLVGSIPGGKEVPISSYAHGSWPENGGRLPVGRGTLSESESKGRKVGVLSGSFLTETTHGRDTYLTVKALGDLQEWSFGYLADGGPGEWAGQKARLNKRYDIFEVSPVLVGAGNGTHTMAVKAAGDGGEQASLPMEDHFRRVLSEIGSFTERTSDLAELRQKEGRVLSSTNRQRITTLLAALREVDSFRAELESLLESTDPDRIRDEGKALEVAFLEAQARINTILHA